MGSIKVSGVAGLDREIDWTGCELVERVPGKVSGRPIVRGTRIMADTIVQDAELGSTLEEIHENYPDLAGLSQNEGHFLQEKAVNIDSHRMQRLDERTWLPTNRCPKRQAHGGP